MKGLTFKRISILSLVLLAASAATAFITKDKKVVRDKAGHLTARAAYTSTANTCRTLVGSEVGNCNDTENAAGSSSAGGVFLTGAGATSDGLAGNTTVGD